MGSSGAASDHTQLGFISILLRTGSVVKMESNASCNSTGELHCTCLVANVNFKTGSRHVIVNRKRLVSSILIVVVY